MSSISNLLIIGRAKGIISITEQMLKTKPERQSGGWAEPMHERQPQQQQQQRQPYSAVHIAQQQAQSSS